MADLDTLKPFSSQLRLSHQVFLLGIAVRVWLTLSLNTSYLHPEENDSQRQLEGRFHTYPHNCGFAIALTLSLGDVFGFWSSHDRVRSTLWPLITNGLPSWLLSLAFGPGRVTYADCTRAVIRTHM
jgi:hypothetical protein